MGADFLQPFHREFVGGFHPARALIVIVELPIASEITLPLPMPHALKIQLISTDFDGTLVSHASDPVFDRDCMELISQLQRDGALWAINTGRSVGLLEEGLEDFAFPVAARFHPNE